MCEYDWQVHESGIKRGAADERARILARITDPATIEQVRLALAEPVPMTALREPACEHKAHMAVAAVRALIEAP